MANRNRERGIALLITVFVIAMGSLLIFEMGRMARYDLSSARGFAERIQGNYIIRSGFSLGQIILAIPKKDGVKADWLGDLWNQLNQLQDLPIQDLPGSPRIQIVDEDAKLNLNVLTDLSDKNQRWVERFIKIFNQLGFTQENYSERENRTVGGAALQDTTQVGAVVDWLDEDDTSFSDSAFAVEGFESKAPPGFFFNRELKSFSEILLIPGITRDRARRMIPFIRVSEISGENPKVNVNTAKYETLVALGYPETTASEIILNQNKDPLTTEQLREMNKIDPTLNAVTTVSSREFSVTVRVKLPNSTRWGKAVFLTQAPGGALRNSNLKSIEIY